MRRRPATSAGDVEQVHREGGFAILEIQAPARVARAAGDGYTLVLGILGHAPSHARHHLSCQGGQNGRFSSRDLW